MARAEAASCWHRAYVRPRIITQSPVLNIPRLPDALIRPARASGSLVGHALHGRSRPLSLPTNPPHRASQIISDAAGSFASGSALFVLRRPYHNLRRVRLDQHSGIIRGTRGGCVAWRMAASVDGCDAGRDLLAPLVVAAGTSQHKPFWAAHSCTAAGPRIDLHQTDTPGDQSKTGLRAPDAIRPIFDSAVLQVIESARQFAPRRQRGTTRSGAAISLR